MIDISDHGLQVMVVTFNDDISHNIVYYHVQVKENKKITNFRAVYTLNRFVKGHVRLLENMNDLGYRNNEITFDEDFYLM